MSKCNVEWEGSVARCQLPFAHQGMHQWAGPGGGVVVRWWGGQKAYAEAMHTELEDVRVELEHLVSAFEELLPADGVGLPCAGGDCEGEDNGPEGAWSRSTCVLHGSIAAGQYVPWSNVSGGE